VKFGPVPLAEALGAVNVHSVKLARGVIRKGETLGADEIARLEAEGVSEIVVVRLEPGDVDENTAADRLAAALVGLGTRAEPAFTGRANLYASHDGLLTVDKRAVDVFNSIDPAITLATLPEFEPVEAGRMLATVKIIPFAAPGPSVAAAERHVAAASALAVRPWTIGRVAVVSTRLPVLKEKTIGKTLKVLADRLAPSGARIVADERVAHTAEAVAAALAGLPEEGFELTVLFGASAVVDAHDAVLEGVRRAGGRIDHFGMPVDPGNLLAIGSFRDRPLLVAPGCARSPQVNGFDWVLERLLAGVSVTPADISGMGVGGLLKEIVSRPQPREDRPGEAEPGAPKVGALIMAAGRSSRMGGPNKLLARLDGETLVARVADAALASRAVEVHAVTGHMAERVAEALGDRDVKLVHNPDFAEGMAGSLKTGLASFGEDVDGVMVLLGDVPRITADDLDRLIAAFDPSAGALIVLPVHEGKRGNPVIWSRAFFPEMFAIEGDVGARHLIGVNRDAVAEVELGAEVLLDLDTPEALAEAGGELLPE